MGTGLRFFRCPERLGHEAAGEHRGEQPFNGSVQPRSREAGRSDGTDLSGTFKAGLPHPKDGPDPPVHTMPETENGIADVAGRVQHADLR